MSIAQAVAAHVNITGLINASMCFPAPLYCSRTRTHLITINFPCTMADNARRRRAEEEGEETVDVTIVRDARYQEENRGLEGRPPAKRMRVEITLAESDIHLVPVIITEGEFRGMRAFVLRTANFRLMDLSPELRLMVFRHLLVRKEKIVVGRPRDQNYMYLVNGTMRLSADWAAHADPIPEKRLTGFNLMLVNKTIREEAAELVYGENSFELRGARAAQRFLTEIGNNAHFLRHVSLRNIDFRGRVGAAIIQYLTSVPQQIRTINLSWGILLNGRQVDPADDFTGLAGPIAQEAWDGGLSAMVRVLKQKNIGVGQVALIIKVIPHWSTMCPDCKAKMVDPSLFQVNNSWRCDEIIIQCGEHFDRCKEIEDEFASVVRNNWNNS